eukprot:4485048-Prymnesium_polylepis.1
MGIRYYYTIQTPSRNLMGRCECIWTAPQYKIKALTVLSNEFRYPSWVRNRSCRVQHRRGHTVASELANFRLGASKPSESQKGLDVGSDAPKSQDPGGVLSVALPQR